MAEGTQGPQGPRWEVFEALKMDARARLMPSVPSKRQKKPGARRSCGLELCLYSHLSPLCFHGGLEGAVCPEFLPALRFVLRARPICRGRRPSDLASQWRIPTLYLRAEARLSHLRYHLSRLLLNPTECGPCKETWNPKGGRASAKGGFTRFTWTPFPLAYPRFELRHRCPHGFQLGVVNN